MLSNKIKTRQRVQKDWKSVRSMKNTLFVICFQVVAVIVVIIIVIQFFQVFYWLVDTHTQTYLHT